MNETPGEYKIQRPIEIKCTECGIVSVPKFQMEIVDGEKFPENKGKYVYSDGCLTLCDECMSKGWTSDPQEIQDAFAKDPAFKLGIKSPYGHKKY